MRFLAFLLFIAFQALGQKTLHFRVNQVGYLPYEHKSAILFSKNPLKEKLQIIDKSTGKSIKTLKPKAITNGNWGTFDYYYSLDFSKINKNGVYYLRASKTKQRSPDVRISSSAYSGYSETLLGFMRQQRCGYNPTLNVYCHHKDGYSFY